MAPADYSPLVVKMLTKGSLLRLLVSQEVVAEGLESQKASQETCLEKRMMISDMDNITRVPSESDMVARFWPE